MRVFITGAGGQLGYDLQAAFSGSHHEVIAADHAACDVTDRDAVMAAITSTRPDAVIHAAAWTAVDACESDPDRAFRVNALGSRFVAEAAARIGAAVHYVSTDYVFDGSKRTPYTEWDEPSPRSVYGWSKLAGEREVQAIAPAATIIRTSWVSGRHGNNMVKTILRLAAEHEMLRFVADQRGHPTFTADLAVAIRRLVVERRVGVFHLTNQGAVSWYGFARAVLEAAGLDPDRVQPISTSELDPPRPAPRPANSVLANQAWEASGLPLLRDFREPLAELIHELGATH
ncbi:MAG: dTDP-4-dehydrorhamnose reductase [Acidimicrobiales bacterium]|nr:dTDP-4-dehydrorhamnose reductase [Acidimicrobiales bacterium]